MTVETLKVCNKKELARLAKEQGVVGWHAMRKDQLIRALSPAESNGKKPTKAVVGREKPVQSAAGSRRPASATTTTPTPIPTSPPTPTSAAKASTAVELSNGQVHAISNGTRPVVTVRPRSLDHGCAKDRIITMVRDPYWLHTYWELSRATFNRARAALGQDWHSARPILRLMDVSSDETTAASERHVRDIDIHGGVNNWYIDVTDPPHAYRVDIGYLSRRGTFFVLARSNVVTTPRAGVSDVLEQNWFSVQEQVQRLYQETSGDAGASAVAKELRELFEERLRRPIQSLSLQSLGLSPFQTNRKFHFQLDAELIVYGSTEPNARVTLQGEPVQLRPDGTFSVRFSLPDARQIIPAVAASPDGVEERTIVLAVERNTKELEPQIHDGNDF